MADGPQTQTFDPDAFHQNYVAKTGGGGFDPDKFHAQFASQGGADPDKALRTGEGMM
jgi:hypothetical protein